MGVGELAIRDWGLVEGGITWFSEKKIKSEKGKIT